MTMKRILFFISATVSLYACTSKNNFDASGNFEADEVIVSARQSGELISYTVQEGAVLQKGEKVGQIDARGTELQKEQAEASIVALQQKTVSPGDQLELLNRQLAVQEAQLAQQQRERTRTENLVKADAATQKQLDDINAAIDQLQKQLAVTRQQRTLNNYNTGTQNRSILSERAPLEKTVARYQELLDQAQVINPVTGTVLTNYALQGEMQSVGKPLYKIANTDTLTLKAYITGEQLPQVKLGQSVITRIDQGKNSYKEYPGTITWIAAKSEFSPKTIQTKNERANLVYAIKVRVKNDGYLKIGMYGEVIWPK